MEEHRFIRLAYIERWRKQLTKVLEEGGMHPDSRAAQTISSVEHQMSVFIGMNANVVPTEMIPGVTKEDVMKDMQVGFTFDYALPQNWVDMVIELIGINPVPHFVWNCDSNTPFPLTPTGKLILTVVYKMA